MKKLERNIYLYEVLLEVYDENKNGFYISKTFKEDCIEMFKCFEKLPFDKQNLDYSMYLKKNNGSYDFVKIDSITEEYIEGKLINCDYNGLTYYENDGELKFLKEALSEEQLIAEVSHFVIFLKDGVMAFEYNPKSSHSPSLANYIKEKTKNKYFIEFKNMLNKSKDKMFDSLIKVRSFKFSTSSKFLKANSALKNGPFRAAKAAQKLIENTDVEHKITIIVTPIGKITKDKKNPYYDADEIKDEIKKADEFKKMVENKNDNDDFELDIVGINELNEKIRVNYTKDFITSKIKLNKGEVESKDFYKKIKENYQKVKEEFFKK